MTRLVVINHASNVTGVVQPVDLIVQAAHDAGALVLLDAAQTVGHLPLSLQHLKVDLLASAGHKGLLGPLGTGIVFVRRGLETELRPVRCGGTGTNSEQLQQPRHMPQKLESGNLNVPGLAGLDAAAQWILDRGVQELHQQIQTHTANLAAGLQQIPEVTLSCWTQGGGGGQRQNTGIVSFNIGDLDCREVALMLDQSAGIQCRAGLHCAPLAHQTLGTFDRGGTVRFSPGPFTTDQQIAAAVDSVSQIAASFR